MLCTGLGQIHRGQMCIKKTHSWLQLQSKAIHTTALSVIPTVDCAHHQRTVCVSVCNPTDVYVVQHISSTYHFIVDGRGYRVVVVV